ncbi:hypothetical protein Tsubulata_005512, partial [Turnera subulata]
SFLVLFWAEIYHQKPEALCGLNFQLLPSSHSLLASTLFLLLILSFFSSCY